MRNKWDNIHDNTLQIVSQLFFAVTYYSYVPFTDRRILPSLTHLVLFFFKKNLYSKFYWYYYFLDIETKVWKQNFSKVPQDIRDWVMVQPQLSLDQICLIIIPYIRVKLLYLTVIKRINSKLVEKWVKMENRKNNFNVLKYKICTYRVYQSFN